MPRSAMLSTKKDFRPGESLVQALRLLLLSLMLAGAGWILRPGILPWHADATEYELELSAPLVELEQARRLFDEGDYLFLDTRREAASAPTTISGAFILREATFDDDLLALMDVVYPEDPLILFGNGELSGPSNVAARLQERGYQNILILRVGVKSWEAAGGDTSTPSATGTGS